MPYMGDCWVLYVIFVETIRIDLHNLHVPVNYSKFFRVRKRPFFFFGLVLSHKWFFWIFKGLVIKPLVVLIKTTCHKRDRKILNSRIIPSKSHPCVNGGFFYKTPETYVKKVQNKLFIKDVLTISDPIIGIFPVQHKDWTLVNFGLSHSVQISIDVSYRT